MEAGSRLGNYEIRDRLGRGGTAEVYRAWQPTIERDVAIKMMFPHLTDSPDFAARFQREARAMGQLQHPNIMRVIEFNVDAERPYMVMEYLDGGSLQEVLTRTDGPLPIATALQIARQLADALQYAHGMGMVHRDIKPANVMFTDGSLSQAMLMDFGMARLVDEGMTATGAILGTPAYMAPEQVRGEAVEAQADLYSLGAMLHEMVTGQPLYSGDSVHELMMKHAEEPIPSSRALNPQVAPELEAIIARLLAKQPHERFGSGAEVVAAIDQLSGVTTLTNAPSPDREATRKIKTGGPPGAASSRSRIGLVAAAVAVAVIAAATVFLLTRADDSADLDTTQVATEQPAPSQAPDPAPVSEPEPEPAAEPAPAPAVDTAEPAAPPPPAPTAEPVPEEPATPTDPAQRARASFDPTNSPSFFPITAGMDGDVFNLAWDRSRQIAGAELNIDTSAESLGPVDIDATGRGSLAVAAPVHLASSIRISATDEAGAETSVLFENTMPAADRASFDSRLVAVDDIDREMAIALDHTTFIRDELDLGDLDEARRHAEHVINIVDGANGPLFGDLDGDGLAQNPGDGVGVIPYASAWLDGGASGGLEQDPIDAAQQALLDAQNAAVVLLSSDTVDEADGAFNGLDESMSLAAAHFGAAESRLKTSAVRTLVGPSLALTGTDTSVGMVAFVPGSNQVVVSTTLPTSDGDLSAQFGDADELVPIESAGFGITSPSLDPNEVGEVVLIDQNGEPVGSGALDATTLDVWTALAALPDDSSIIALADGQAQIAADHGDLLREEVEADNHPEVRRHAEHVVNIIVGEQSATFGDLDGDGVAQNPGDGVGLLVYLNEIDAELDRLPAATIEQRFHQQQFRTALASVRSQAESARDEALRVLATDSSGEAVEPMLAIVADTTAALVGFDVDASGFIDGDERGIRDFTQLATALLSAPLEP